MQRIERVVRRMKVKWFERKFDFILKAESYPFILERLRGTPARLEEKVKGVSQEKLASKSKGSWSIQEHAGHLLDLEELWLGRLDDFVEGKEELRPADLENRKTHEADHNAKSIDVILGEFRRVRHELVRRLDEIGEEKCETAANHPRLKKPMRILDMVFFIAEHDDHHLTNMSEVLK